MSEGMFCCGEKMAAIHRMQPPTTLEGWWCKHCDRFEKAIGRERRLPLNYDKEIK